MNRRSTAFIDTTPAPRTSIDWAKLGLWLGALALNGLGWWAAFALIRLGL